MGTEFLKSFRLLEKQIRSFDLSKNAADEAHLLSLLDSLRFIAIPFTKIVPKIDRITVNKRLPDNSNETINEIKYLRNPPPQIINKYGRANLKNQSILYGTFILPTAILETNPDVDDLVTVSTWKLQKNDTPLTVYPVFDFFKTKDMQLKNIFNSVISKYPVDLQELIIMDSCLIACYFSKSVEVGKEINYTFSAHIADKILNEKFDGKIDAIIYPSVKDPSQSENIALKPEIFINKYELEKVIESRVISKNPKSVLLQEIKRTNTFDNFFLYW